MNKHKLDESSIFISRYYFVFTASGFTVSNIITSTSHLCDIESILKKHSDGNRYMIMRY